MVGQPCQRSWKEAATLCGYLWITYSLQHKQNGKVSPKTFGNSGTSRTVQEQSTGNTLSSGQVRSGMGEYAGAARRRVHLATVLLRPLSGHRPGRRQARHARILQIGFHLTQPRSVWHALSVPRQYTTSLKIMYRPRYVSMYVDSRHLARAARVPPPTICLHIFSTALTEKSPAEFLVEFYFLFPASFGSTRG